MSKFLKISSAAVLSVLYAAPALASITPPTIYGGLYLDTRGSEDKVTKTYSDGTKTVEKTKYRQQLYDNGSRMGIRGEEALNNDISVQYRFEWRSPLDSDQRAFEPRDSWLAIKHKKYGTFKAGRLLSPEPYIRYTWDYPTWGADGNRSNNAIRYESPTFNGTDFMIHYVLDENKKGGESKTESLDTDGVGLLVKHQKDNYALGAAYFYADSQKSLHGVKFKDQLRLTGYYDFDKANQINFIYQKNKFNDVHYGQAAKNNWGLGVGASHKFNDKDTVYAHVNHAVNPYGKDGKYNSVTVAYDRKITDKLILGAESTYYKETINVPAHADKDGKAVLAHKQDTDSLGLILFSAYRF
ncbi:porin [Moraxella nasicaprae]|uniref:Porin n=1 Tax=Moraxella nasicaprae TaxID=2904122 RepID=A0ABY6F6C3_9GAMM|nr:porin [Moraxella nasicaprae]UXZ05638.1 porin [Moraxella nasicaprae]